MKKLLVALLLSCKCLSSQAQEIPLDSFFAPGTTWTQAVYDDDQWQFNYHEHHWGAYGIVFRVERDTMLAGIKYHLLSVMSVGGYGYNFSNYTGTPHSSFESYGPSGNYRIFGRIRTDSNKVYFTRDSVTMFEYYGTGFIQGTEYLVYDFNLSIGTRVIDTPGPGISVSSIDSITVSSGAYIKRYADTGSGYYWLRGIGSSSGLLFGYSLLNMGPGVYIRKTTALCYDNPAFSYHFNYPDSILLGNLQNDCFNIIPMLGVTNINARTQHDIMVYPNPLNDNNLYFSGDDLQEVDKLTISDIAGRVLYLYQQPFTSGENQLSVSLSQGLYLLRFQKKDHSVLEKKIVRQ
jgi:hypothetical protein